MKNRFQIHLERQIEELKNREYHKQIRLGLESLTKHGGVMMVKANETCKNCSHSAYLHSPKCNQFSYGAAGWLTGHCTCKQFVSTKEKTHDP